MSNRTIQTLLVLIGLALCGIALRSLLTLHSVRAEGQSTQTSKESKELARLFEEDQADRTPPNGKPIDWTIIAPRDKARLARVKELYAQDRLKTGADYYHAAMILQHGDVAEDFCSHMNSVWLPSARATGVQGHWRRSAKIAF